MPLITVAISQTLRSKTVAILLEKSFDSWEKEDFDGVLDGLGVEPMEYYACEIWSQRCHPPHTDLARLPEYLSTKALCRRL